MGQTHLSVQQRIKKIAQHFTGCDYHFASWAQLDEVLDHVRDGRPTICYILPPTGEILVKTGATTFYDRPFTMIAFISTTKLDFDGEENDAIVEKMKTLAMSFVKELNRSGLFEMIDNESIEYKVPYDTTDDNCTGIIVTLPIVEERRVSCSISNEFGYIADIDEDEE